MAGTPATHPVQLWLREAAVHVVGRSGARMRGGGRAVARRPPGRQALASSSAIMAVPVAAVIYLALSPADNAWPHLLATVLPESLAQTIWLAVGTGALTLDGRHGRGVARHHVPVSGPRAARPPARHSPRRPDVHHRLLLRRDLRLRRPGADGVARAGSAGPVCATTGFPISARSAAPSSCCPRSSIPTSISRPARRFIQQSVCTLEVARTLGRTSMGAFWSVALPLARPGPRCRHGARGYGMLQRSWSRPASRRADPLGEHLFHVRSAPTWAAPHSLRRSCCCWSSYCSRSSAWRAAAPRSTTPPAATAPFRSRTSKAGGATPQQFCARCLFSPASCCPSPCS